MEKNDLPVIRAGFIVDRSVLDTDRYVDSLFGEALRLGLADDSDSARILDGIAQLLFDAVSISSEGESTSVREETAVMMTKSITYVIGVGLMSEPAPEDAVSALLGSEVRALYYNGLHLLNMMKTRADLLRLLLVRTKKPDQSQAYYRFTDIVAKNYISEYEPKYDAAKAVFVDLPELAICKTVHGLYELVKIMRRLIDYNRTPQ